MRRFCVAGLVGLSWTVACAADPAPPPPAARTTAPAPPPPAPPRGDPLFEDPEAFEVLPPPAPSGWRTRFAGPGQSYIDYVASNPRRPQAGHDRLYLLPLAELGMSVVVDAEVTYIVRTPSGDAMAQMLSTFYGLPAEVLPPLGLEDVAFPERIHQGHEQFRAQSLLRDNAHRVPPDAYSMTTLMVQDVFFDDAQTYGFGFGQHRGGQAVVSFARIDPVVSGLAREPDVDQRLPLRAFKLLVHEVGHTFGFEHCTAHRCVMNGVADLAELDATPLHLCPDCLRKLLYVHPQDPMARYAALAELYGTLALGEPRAWTLDRLERLREREPAP